MGEFEFIAKIKEMFAAIPSGIDMEGIGDDCAVIPMGDGQSMVITTDMLIEGTHFLRAAVTPRQIGRKSLAVNLSDVAAMGARPVAALLSLGLPAECVGEWAEEFMAGVHEMAEKYGVALIGGDTTASKNGIAINIVALGVAPAENIKRRSAAQPGDLIAVAGRLGGSAAGLARVLAGDYNSPQSLLHHNPEPQVNEGIWLGGREEVHAMIDLSDGLASDLVHILKASNAGAQIDIDAIPTDFSLAEALTGGEDYKLLFTFSAKDADRFVEKYRQHLGEIYVIGSIVTGPPQIEWRKGEQITQGDWHGYTHF